MGRKLTDMTGMRIGRLTVLEYVGGEKWRCRCDCGNIVVRRGGNLRGASNASCGCLAAEISRKNGQTKKKHLVGTQSGNLDIIEFVGLDGNEEVYRCKCECGAVINVKRRYLVDGSKTHCGCRNRIDMIGKRVGRLKVVEYSGIGKHGTALWKCECDCGNTKVIDGALLRSGMSTSCGCLHRETTSVTHKKYNDYEIDGDVVKVKLSNTDRVMLCDVEDWERLKSFCWSVDAGGYAKTNTADGPATFHSMILDCPDGYVCDHISRDRLDNRRSNLRIATPKVNARNTGISKNNTTGYKGVTYSRRYGKYVAQISVEGKTYCLGRFDNARDAYIARLEGEKKYFGEVYSEPL